MSTNIECPNCQLGLVVEINNKLFCEDCKEEIMSEEKTGLKINETPLSMSYTNCIIVGHNSGIDLRGEDGVVIIGDNIRNLDKTQSDVIFLGDKVAIGKTIGGIECNLYDIFIELTK